MNHVSRVSKAIQQALEEAELELNEDQKGALVKVLERELADKAGHRELAGWVWDYGGDRLFTMEPREASVMSQASTAMKTVVRAVFFGTESEELDHQAETIAAMSTKSRLN
jgi:hypothetical protein